MSSDDQRNPNIQVEMTDASEFHCFRLVLNPKSAPAGDLSACCGVPALPNMKGGLLCAACGNDCDIAVPSHARMEVMLHARSLVDLIHKCCLALCDWQKQTTTQLICQKTGLSEEEARKAGLIG
jgi:hypothetical protein